MVTLFSTRSRGRDSAGRLYKGALAGSRRFIHCPSPAPFLRRPRIDQTTLCSRVLAEDYRREFHFAGNRLDNAVSQHRVVFIERVLGTEQQKNRRTDEQTKTSVPSSSKGD